MGGTFNSCSYCRYSKEEQEQENIQTITTKVGEEKESRTKKVTTENIDIPQRLTIYSDSADSNNNININITKTKTKTQTKSKPTQPKISYILPESISKRENIESYYQIFPTLLAQGGCSQIFLARNEKDRFAIKQISKGGVAKPEELVREANISLQLKHKNIITYYDIFEDKDYIYFVMELGDKGDLFDFITCDQSGCLSPDISIDLLIQIFEAVDYLHTEKKIIHRDLKPENFLLKIDENNFPIIKLIDFGLAINLPNNGEKLNELIGTRKYASPEMITGVGYNEKIDEWAIGVIMFSMLTGYEPFRRTGEHQVEESILYAKIDFEIIPDYELRVLNEKLLDRNESTRITCKEALLYLRELKKLRENVYNDDYYKYQRHLFIENYKAMLNDKLNIFQRNTI